MPERSVFCRTEPINSCSLRSRRGGEQASQKTKQLRTVWSNEKGKFQSWGTLTCFVKKKTKGVQGFHATTMLEAVVTITLHRDAGYFCTAERAKTLFIMLVCRHRLCVSCVKFSLLFLTWEKLSKYSFFSQSPVEEQSTQENRHVRSPNELNFFNRNRW